MTPRLIQNEPEGVSTPGWAYVRTGILGNLNWKGASSGFETRSTIRILRLGVTRKHGLSETDNKFGAMGLVFNRIMGMDAGSDSTEGERGGWRRRFQITPFSPTGQSKTAPNVPAALVDEGARTALISAGRDGCFDSVAEQRQPIAAGVSSGNEVPKDDKAPEGR